MFKSLKQHNGCWILTRNQMLDNQILQPQQVWEGVLFPLSTDKTLCNSRKAAPEKRYKKSIGHQSINPWH